jgi:hypothetical protein
VESECGSRDRQPAGLNVGFLEKPTVPPLARGMGNTMPTPTWQTFVAYFLAAFGAGIGWSLGNLLVVFLSRVILTH